MNFAQNIKYYNFSYKYKSFCILAIAAGMMLCASFSLIFDGAITGPDESVYLSELFSIPSQFSFIFTPFCLTFFGIIFGVVFIIITKNILDKYDNVQVDELTGFFLKWNF